MQLARHPHGAPVLDALYVKLPSSKRAAVLAEFYGREFQLLMLQERSSGEQRRPSAPLRQRATTLCRMQIWKAFNDLRVQAQIPHTKNAPPFGPPCVHTQACRSSAPGR